MFDVIGDPSCLAVVYNDKSCTNKYHISYIDIDVIKTLYFADLSPFDLTSLRSMESISERTVCLVNDFSINKALGFVSHFQAKKAVSYVFFSSPEPKAHG